MTKVSDIRLATTRFRKTRDRDRRSQIGLRLPDRAHVSRVCREFHPWVRPAIRGPILCCAFLWAITTYDNHRTDKQLHLPKKGIVLYNLAAVLPLAGHPIGMIHKRGEFTLKFIVYPLAILPGFKPLQTPP